MERSFKDEVAKLRLGEGEVFHGEAIVAVAKALLQSGVAYVGGYQGAPVSHMMDVLEDARDLLDELGVHVEANANEAAAAAMLGASINYPVRGAVTFKSTVGTNVAADALSNLASAGVRGGAVIILGEDYGEGASIIQERSHAFALKSQMWLLDPRPSLPKIVEMVEQGVELSEASATPVLLELRIRACHLQGSFRTKANRPPRYSRRAPLPAPDFDYGRICLPPSTYAQEKAKIEVRLPAALRFVQEHRLNELFGEEKAELGIVCQGGLYNGVMRALAQLGHADRYGRTPLSILCLNVTYPLVAKQIAHFCRAKRAVLVVEEGQPAYLEDAIGAILRRDANSATVVHGKDLLPMAGEYTGEVLVKGLAAFLGAEARAFTLLEPKRQASELLRGLPPRPPGFCTGCPERPVFAAMKLAARDTGDFHVSADIGCHTFATLPPFEVGHTVLGYGLGLAANSAASALFGGRSVSVMGDGGFWHNGLTSGVAGAVFNRDAGVLVIMKNGYSSATGTQELPSSPQHSPARSDHMSIESALSGVGVKWVRTVDNYRVGEVKRVLVEALTSPEPGLKVIVAEGECQLERQRRLRPDTARRLAAGERLVRVRYGVDEDVCTGDHSCMRLSGCPTLTLKDNPDPLRREPVATVIDGCVGCGLCGENAHAAGLCPSFYRAEIVHNPSAWDRLRHAARRLFHGTAVR